MSMQANAQNNPYKIESEMELSIKHKYFSSAKAVF
jgi:hypothetical protein